MNGLPTYIAAIKAEEKESEVTNTVQPSDKSLPLKDQIYMIVQGEEPFLYRMNKAPWEQAKMLQAAQSGDPVMAEEYDKVFGPDQASGDWNPANVSIPSTADFDFDIYHHRPAGFDLRSNLRAKICWNILKCIKELVLDGKKDIIGCLYHPGTYSNGMEKAAFLRKEVILTEFESVRGFAEFMSRFKDDAKGSICEFPRNRPLMDIDQVIQYFYDCGDQDGARLAKLYKAIFPWYPNLLQHLSQLISNSVEVIYP